MKSARGVFLNDTLYLGGGYTGNSKTDILIYTYNFTSSKWDQLPPSPTKWSAMSVLDNRLVLIGGRGMNNSSKLMCYTNKTAVWNRDEWKWDFTLPSMLIPRMSPIVINHQGCLIVAGGKKGSLDYNVEVLPAKAKRWVCAPTLPSPCLNGTSTVVGGEWYLLDQRSGVVWHTSVSGYVKQLVTEESPDMKDECKLVPLSNQCPSAEPSCSNILWEKLLTNPPAIPFKIASSSTHLLAFSDSETSGMNVDAHVYQEGLWTKVAGRPPWILRSATLLAMTASDSGQELLCLIGGQTGHVYSKMSYQLTLMTGKELKILKKSRHTRVSLDNTVEET